MKAHIQHSLLIYLFFTLYTNATLIAGQNDNIATNNNTSLNRATLVFLNDSESDDAPSAAQKMGAISIAFSLALVQQAGPIIVSASILANMRQRENPVDTSFSALMERFNTLHAQFNELNDAEIMEFKNIYRYLLPFNEDTPNLFVIKKISAELYLLIPKKYLNSLNIDEKEVAFYTDAPTLTKAELRLGMKINHLQTVTDINTIQKPLPIPPFADYFIDALHNKKQSIFITNTEYYAHNEKDIPLWSIYISGHGSMGGKIAALSIPQFKDFLTFLEHKIHTKLLYYFSCYAAGANHEELYKDMESAINKTYSFAIITHAITDATIRVPDIRVIIEDGNPVMTYSQRYRRFIEHVLTSEIIDYKTLANYFQTYDLGSMLPQIKLPGLPWFSIIHEDRVASIGSILAKTRTKPLNIENFFARKGKKAAPLGILIYSYIPFELIINSQTPEDLPPTIISMIPGNAIHHIKKISSSVHSVEKLITSFFQIKDLEAKKLFVIHTLTGTGAPSHVYNVFIELTPEKNTVYYMQDGVLHKDMVATVNETDIKSYKELIALFQMPEHDFSKKTADKTTKTITPTQEPSPLRATPPTPQAQQKRKNKSHRTQRKKTHRRCAGKSSR